MVEVLTFQKSNYKIKPNSSSPVIIGRRQGEKTKRIYDSRKKSGRYDKHKMDRMSIRIESPRKDKEGVVSFITGWTVYPNGRIQLNTPYGGK